ncbi:MAG: RNA polymerase sigma factor [Terriglobales bacterium]
MSNPTDNATTEHWIALQQQSDEQLAASLLAGEQDALAVLFDRYHRLVYSVAMRIVHDPGEAEEVVQTVFLDFYRALANFDAQRGILKVWLLQYAYHRALHRKRHLVANRFYAWVELEGSATEPRLSWSPSESFETARLMEQMLATLPPRRRSILELTYLEGLTADEIAARLAISVNVVRHDLYRGLTALRDIAGQQLADKPKEATKGEGHRASASAI